MTESTRPVCSDSRLAQQPLLFISGQVPLVGGEVRDDIGAQTAACLDRIERLPGERSVGMDRLVKVTYFLTDSSDLDGVRAVLRQRLPHPAPVASLVVSALVDPRFRIEIEAVAALGELSPWR